MKFNKIVEETIKKIPQYLEGGRSDGFTLEDISKKHNISITELQKQIDIGIEIEMEHTNDKTISKKIVFDHLCELPNYYDLLKEMEIKGKKLLNVNPI